MSTCYFMCIKIYIRELENMFYINTYFWKNLEEIHHVVISRKLV